MEGKSNNTDILLQTCLEKILSGQGTLDSVLAEVPDQADALRPELEAALWLTSIRPALDPRPGFMAASRRRVVSRIGQKRPPVLSPVHRLAQFSRKRLVFQFSLGILLVIVLLTGNILTAAAQQTIPGDVLYPLKTFGEGARLTFSFTPASRARLRLEFARRRISEVEALALEGRYQAASTTLAGFDQQVSQAVTLLDELKQTGSVEVQELAVSLSRLIDDQVEVTSLLTASAPAAVKAELDVVVQNSADKMADMRDELLDLAVIPTPTATVAETTPGKKATLSRAGSPSAQPDRQRPTSTDTPSPSRTSRPSNTPKPTFTSRPSNTPRSSNTPRPSNTPQPTHTPRSTDPPQPANTRKSPKTDSPTPTPRPTKTSKP